MSATTRWFADAPVAQADRARAEVSRFPTLRAWWVVAERGDWMLWAAGRAGADSRLLVAAALECVRTILDHLDEDARAIAVAALLVAERWCDGRVGPAECDTAAHKVNREAERTQPISDPRVAAARLSALGAVESVVLAAASDDRTRCAKFAAEAARRVAGTYGRLQGPDEVEAAHARCAAVVRRHIAERWIADHTM